MTRTEALIVHLMRGNKLTVNHDVYSYAYNGFRKNGGIDLPTEQLIPVAMSFEFDPIYQAMTTPAPGNETATKNLI